MSEHPKMAREANTTMIVDLQYGSTGKGLIAGYIATHDAPDIVITANMPNAGHTFVDARGNKMVHKVLPNGIVSPEIRAALIGPGSVFSPSRLKHEIEELYKFGYQIPYIMIHPNAMVLNEGHAEAERKSLNAISSTMQGSAAALVEKIMRNNTQNTALISRELKVVIKEVNEYCPHTLRVVTHSQYLDAILHADNILAEGAQGYSLGINGPFYPYCTSRDCTPARFLADMGIPVPLLKKVVGTARMHPIRVGNTDGGTSGPSYQDQKELTWEALGVEPEFTTVTGRVRRVFTFSWNQINDAIAEAQPDEVFLNFCNYDAEMAPKLVTGIEASLINNTVKGGRVRYLGWGPSVKDVQDRYLDFNKRR